ncbi:MAG: alpha/beta hydrolase [Fulvivirga sp.]
MNNEIHFTDEGEGFPLLFIHGFCETHEMWDDFKIPFLKDFRVITVDLPGFGNSPLPDGGFTLADIADVLADFLDSLNIKQVVVVGHSLGGYVTLELAKLKSELIKGFCLFHSTAYADDEEKKDSRNKTIDFVEKRGVKVFATSFVPSLFYSKNRKNLTSEIDNAVAIASKTPLPTLVAYTKAMRDRQDRTDVLESFSNPILFIAGVKDTSVPLEKIEPQFLLPKRAVVKVLENTGHMGMFEKKTETQQMVKAFIASLEV